MKKETKIKIFQWLANLLYKSFNVIERGDSVIIHGNKHPCRILDIYDNGTIDYMCDSDPSSMREKTSLYKIKLHSKFFRGEQFLRNDKNDNGYRLFDVGGLIGIYNFKNKKILKIK